MEKNTCCCGGDGDMRKFFEEHEDLCKKMFETMCGGKGQCSHEEIFRLMRERFGAAPKGETQK
jgi:hypothetical protein